MVVGPGQANCFKVAFHLSVVARLSNSMSGAFKEISDVRGSLGIFHRLHRLFLLVSDLMLYFKSVGFENSHVVANPQA